MTMYLSKNEDFNEWVNFEKKMLNEWLWKRKNECVSKSFFLYKNIPVWQQVMNSISEECIIQRTNLLRNFPVGS